MKKESLSLDLAKLVLIASIVVDIGILSGAVFYSLYKTGTNPGAQKEGIQPKIASQKTQSDAAVWNIFSDPEYGFEIKYPANWKVAAAEKSDKTDSNLQKAFDFLPQEGNSEGRIVIEIYNRSARRYTEYTGTVLRAKGDHDIVLNASGLSEGTEMENIYSLMPATFKYTGKEASSAPSETDLDVSSWKTYKNGKYGFELKYPQNFTLNEPSIVGDSLSNDVDLPFAIDLQTDITEKSGHDWNSGFVLVKAHQKNTSLKYGKDVTKAADAGIDELLQKAYAGEKGVLTYRHARTNGRQEIGEIVSDSFSYYVLLTPEEKDYDYSVGIQFYYDLGEEDEIARFVESYKQILSSFKFAEEGKSLSVVDTIMLHGTPEIYGEELDVSYDNPADAVDKMKIYDQTYGKGLIKLSGEKLERYTRIGLKISCEFCCTAKAIVDETGKAACGCNHSGAMRGLLAYLIDKHGDAYGDDQMLREIARWKVAFFPQKMSEKVVKELNSGKYSFDVEALLLGADREKLKEGLKDYDETNFKLLPIQEGGC